MNPTVTLELRPDRRVYVAGTDVLFGLYLITGDGAEELCGAEVAVLNEVKMEVESWL